MKRHFAVLDDPGFAPSERNALLVTYVLYGLGCFFFLTAIAGVIINHIKIGELTPGSAAWTHHRWQMRTFWFTMLWSLVCLLLTPVFAGLVGYILLWLWCLYRFIRGMLAFAEHRPVPY